MLPTRNFPETIAMKTRTTISLLCSFTLASLGTYFSVSAPAIFAQADYSVVNTRNTIHINSCGSCHLPYSPGLLPLESWVAVLAGMENHFGTTVELSAANSAHILTYLEEHALQSGQSSVMGQLAAELPDPPALRITALPVFVNLHSDAAELLGYEKNEQAPLGRCENCHRAAASHIFDKALLRVGHGDGPLSDYK